MSAIILHPCAPKVNLCANARLLMREIRRLAKGHPECWASNETLARVVGCCVRTVKNCLKKLRLAGLIDVIPDYGLRSRRRLLLDPLSAPLPTPVETQKEFVFSAPISEFLGGNSCPQSGQMLPPTTGLPPDPPIEVPEGNTEGELVFDPPPDGETTTTLGLSSPLPSPDTPTVEPAPEPEPAAVAEAVRAAEAVFGPGVEGRVRAEIAKGTAPDWVRRAAEAAGKAARKAGSVGWGYVVATLKDWRSVGGPPPSPRAAAPPSRSASITYHVARAHRELMASPGPEGDPA